MPDRYTLSCPHCGEETLVDDEVRRILLREGCVLCGGALSDPAFEPLEARDASGAGES